MDLTSMKYWQWGVIGVVLGAIIGFSWMGMPSEVPRSADANEFKRDLGRMGVTEATKGLPQIMNIVVKAPEVDQDGKLVYPVTFDRLGRNREDKAVFQEQGIYARTPFDGNDSIIDYLNKREVAFSNHSGPGKYRPVGYGAAIGVLAIGFIWPTILRFMVGAGIAKPKPREKERKYTSGDIDDGTIKDKKAGVNARDMNDLNSLNDRLEASVGKGLKPGSKQDQAKEVDEIVSKLMSSSAGRNTSDPTATQVTAEPEKPKDYKGEWYPVARPKANNKEG